MSRSMMIQLTCSAQWSSGSPARRCSMPDLERLGQLVGQVVVVGVGESDYVHDYRRTRAGERFSDGYGYAATAFKRALADATLGRDDIDGLVVGPTLAYERTAEVLGIEPRWAAQA